MLKLKKTSTFKKQYKKIINGGRYKEEDFVEVLNKLVNQEVLDRKYSDHSLEGQKREIRELHINPDWLLIYIIGNEELILTLVQTGSHTDLFGHSQQF